MIDQSYLRRNLFEPLFFLKNRSPRLRHWKELEKSQYLPLEQQLKKQWERLTALLNYAYTSNPFYSNLFKTTGLHPKDIKSPVDFRKLPILTKKDVRNSVDTLISTGFKKEHLLKFKTGGSTGKALEIYITEECSEIRNACARRNDRWSGWQPGEPIGALWGNAPKVDTLKERLINAFISPTIYLDTMSLSKESVIEFEKQWQHIQPTLLFGHAHSIYNVAVMARQYSCTGIRPKAIVSSSMMLLPHERKLIEEIFEVKVTDRYGCEEVSLIASECERHEGMHLNIEHLYIEFLDDNNQPVKPGEPGRIIVTDLFNKAMPFIRYQVEDVGIYTEKMCSCGRGLPLMTSVSGRVADFLVRRNGTRVAGISLIENTLTKITGIDQMQIEQETLNTVRLNIVTGKGYCDKSHQQLFTYFSEEFGNSVEIKINVVENIQAEKNGKYRFSICKL